ICRQRISNQVSSMIRSKGIRFGFLLLVLSLLLFPLIRQEKRVLIVGATEYEEAVAKNAQKQLEPVPQVMEETVKKVEKASKTWAQLIARIYEVDPLICATCGKKIKIIAFVIH